MRAVLDPSRFMYRDHPSVLPHCWEAMGEDHIENLDKEGYHSLLGMLQGPVWSTIRARSLPDIENPDGP
jgi:hypothetical protein